jgi:hypothetical protein
MAFSFLYENSRIINGNPQEKLRTAVSLLHGGAFYRPIAAINATITR